MWREYSSGYIKNNRASGLSVMIAAFISALLLSLLCGTFYNLWKYEVERIELEEGGWQSRILGTFTPEDAETIKNFANIEDVVINEPGYREEKPPADLHFSGAKPSIDLYFSDMRAVLSDTPHIAEQLGIPRENIVYNYELLAIYLIHGSDDTAPRLLFPMFLLIVVAASFSLIIIVHNSFAVSMNARIHQCGRVYGGGAAYSDPFVHAGDSGLRGAGLFSRVAKRAQDSPGGGAQG